MSKLEQKFSGFVFSIFLFPFLIILAVFKGSTYHWVLLTIIFIVVTADLWKMLFEISLQYESGKRFVLMLYGSAAFSTLLVLLMEFYNYKNIMIIFLLVVFWLYFSFIYSRPIAVKYKDIVLRYFER